MAEPVAKHATVGVAEHGNSAILITVAPDNSILDRRRVDLTHDLPTHPYHHEGSWAVGRYLNSSWAREISLNDAVALVERVHEAADRGAREILEQLAGAVPVPIASIAIRICPNLPATIEERITDTRSGMSPTPSCTAGSRGGGSSARLVGALVRPEHVFGEAAAAVGRKDIGSLLAAMGRSLGAPWQATHKLAAAAAIANFTARARSVEHDSAHGREAQGRIKIDSTGILSTDVQP